MISAKEGLARLIEGNRRFVADERLHDSRTHRAELAQGQEPFAVVLGCADSRVPAEIVFDQGLGDLFVIRVAGNIVAASQIGSIEFAAEYFHVRLVVVLGHTQCGAVQVTLDELRRPVENQSPSLRSIVDRVRIPLEPLLAAGLGSRPEELLKQAVRANIRASVDHLRHGSALLEQRVERGELSIVGAEYSLETGVIDFLDKI